MKHYRISVSDGIVTLGEQVIASDNRGIKGGIVPPHVVDYAIKYARDMREPGYMALTVELCSMPLVSSTGVIPGKLTPVLNMQLQQRDAPAGDGGQ
jgi:hypothetical protein